MIEFWKKECNGYYEIGVRQNTEEEMNAPLMWFFDGLFTEDLIYTGLNFDFVVRFLSDIQILKGKKAGKYRSYDDMRKFRDAINNGAKIRGETLPTEFTTQLDAWLASYKKKFVKQKQRGKAEQ